MAARMERKIAPGDLERRGARSSAGSGNTVVDQFFDRTKKRTDSYVSDVETARAVLQALERGQQPSAEQLRAIKLMSPKRRAALGLQKVQLP